MPRPRLVQKICMIATLAFVYSKSHGAGRTVGGMLIGAGGYMFGGIFYIVIPQSIRTIWEGSGEILFADKGGTREDFNRGCWESTQQILEPVVIVKAQEQFRERHNLPEKDEPTAFAFIQGGYQGVDCEELANEIKRFVKVIRSDLEWQGKIDKGHVKKLEQRLSGLKNRLGKFIKHCFPNKDPRDMRRNAEEIMMQAKERLERNKKAVGDQLLSYWESVKEEAETIFTQAKERLARNEKFDVGGQQLSYWDIAALVGCGVVVLALLPEAAVISLAAEILEVAPPP
eukprot:TRINITY_DN19845_c0_g1_i1.p1 TRINITY_DN19845_c0_g1~~TRINITY_DN19845_c0_g1_i1.p1  ORF type:complete len:286 (+),score=41.34 TRINITY_DN19845_c0_g1_i1:66-923(+)